MVDGVQLMQHQMYMTLQWLAQSHVHASGTVAFNKHKTQGSNVRPTLQRIKCMTGNSCWLPVPVPAACCKDTWFHPVHSGQIQTLYTGRVEVLDSCST